MGIRSTSCSSFLAHFTATNLKGGIVVIGIVNVPEVFRSTVRVFGIIKCIVFNILTTEPFELRHEEKLCEGKETRRFIVREAQEANRFEKVRMK